MRIGSREQKGMTIQMANYRLLLQYDGTRYSGWQKQGNTDNTIQGRLEKIFTQMLGEPAEVIGSGRTDAGVHACGQVANVRGTARDAKGHPLTTLQIRDQLNNALPMDIRVLEVTEAPPRFHARLNVAGKHYRYVVDCGAVAHVFERRYVARIPGEYDLEEMRKAADALQGTHDFKCFCENKHMKKSTVRSIQRIDLSMQDGLLSMDFYGNGFLYHMVRILAGTLLEVGSGKRSAQSVDAALKALSRPTAGFTAPAQGLSLVEVFYDSINIEQSVDVYNIPDIF